MINNMQKLIFFMTLMSGTMITISSSSWLSAWMGLEINLLSFIPLINNSYNLMSSETALKYFMTQAIASSIFFIAVVISMLKEVYSNLSYFYQILILIALMIKAGIAPFHFWFPTIMEGLSWMNSLILLTWQKIAPLFLIYYIFNMNMMILPIIISAIVGAMGGLNQTSLRKLMAFSSINHLAWMLTSMQESMKMFLIYFIFYMVLSTAVVMIFYLTNTFHMDQLFFIMNNSTSLKFMVFANLLSMGGLPPFIGFIPKWMIIQQITFVSQMSIIMILILSSLITLFFYLRLCYSAFMIGTTNFQWNNSSYKMKFNNVMFNLTIISLLGFPLISMFMI